MNIFEKVFKEFNKAGIKYLDVGGVAVSLHGYVRFTGDLDLLLLLDGKNLEKVDKVMHKLGYSERLPVSVMSLNDESQVKKWLKDKNIKAFSFVPPKDNPLQIDIVIEESLKFDKFFKDKINKRIENVTIPVASIDHLIKMKRKADRKQDMIDLEALIKLKKL